MKLGPITLNFRSAKAQPEPSTPVIPVDALPAAYQGGRTIANWEESIFDGEKFFGGMGPAQVPWTDYWTLRQRSSELFTQNLYARGLIRRLVTNEINTGLQPESRPDEEILGLKPGALTDWSETVENRFGLWADQPDICDHFRADTFAALQRAIRQEALISGDVLLIVGQHPTAKVPRVRIVDAELVQSPLGGDGVPKSHTVSEGVERDAAGRVVAYWIRQDIFKFQRIKARNSSTGRKVAWLVFGSPKRYKDERGTPLLADILQSLKEIDRYRDATARKAVLNSILAMFIKKTDDKPSTLPLTGGATRKGQSTEAQAVGSTRNYNIASQIPGMVLEELQTGEEPHGFASTGVDEKFGEFEEAMINAIAWTREIPPEILRLAFSNNYSASQAAINEFKIYLNLVWGQFGESVCGPIYQEWLISEVLEGRVRAPGLLDVWRDPSKYAQFGAWVATDWYGSIKPSTDMLKQAKGSELLLGLGLTTRARESRTLTGTKFSKNMRRLKVENEMLAEALEPIAAMERPEPPDQIEDPDKEDE